MTQEDKDLLLKDLCARLPYGVKVSKVVEGWTSEPHLIRSINLNNIVVEDGEFEDGTPDIDVWDYEDIKPYLFPLSSMTEEQKRKLRQMDAFVSTFGQICFSTYDDYGHELMPTCEDSIRVTNWLNKNHFDYRGLIEKGLAIDATGLNIY